MDCLSCLSLIFDDQTPAERNALKEAILKATEQIHMDYAHTLTQSTVTHYYKYNGPSTYSSAMTIISKRRDVASYKHSVKALARMYDAIGLHGFAGIIIQYDNTSIILNNNGQTRRSIPLYITIQLSKVTQKGA